MNIGSRRRRARSRVNSSNHVAIHYNVENHYSSKMRRRFFQLSGSQGTVLTRFDFNNDIIRSVENGSAFIAVPAHMRVKFVFNGGKAVVVKRYEERVIKIPSSFSEIVITYDYSGHRTYPRRNRWNRYIPSENNRYLGYDSNNIYIYPDYTKKRYLEYFGGPTIINLAVCLLVIFLVYTFVINRRI